MSMRFRPQQRPSEPTLAELVDNIRRNLECANVPIYTNGGLNQIRECSSPGGARSRTWSRGTVPVSSPGNGPEALSEPSPMRPRRFSRGARPLEVGDQGNGCRSSPRSPALYPETSVGFPPEGISQQRPYPPNFDPRGPMPLCYIQQNATEDYILREIAAASCNFSRGGSRTPSEVASEDTYEIVNTLREDWDPENEVWRVIDN